MTFEYDRLKRFATMKCEFVDFFNYAIILNPIKGYRTNYGICGSSIGPTLLVPSCSKAISIHIITGVWQDPISTTIGNLSQLGTHRRIILGLQVEAGWFVILFARTPEFVIHHMSNKKYLVVEPRNQIGGSLSRTVLKKGVNFLQGWDPSAMPELLSKLPVWTRSKGGWMQNSYYWKEKVCWALTVCTARHRIG